MDDRRRWPAWIAAVVAVVALGFAVFSAYPLLRYSTYAVGGESMEPTIPADGRMRAESFDGEARTGDIVLLRLPGDPKLVVKRVVAVGGQRVSAAGGNLLVNGKPLDEPYLPRGERAPRGLRPVTVPTGEVYVLGDNRQSQIGSNFTDIGPVPQRTIEERVIDTDPPATLVQIGFIALGVAVAVIAGLLCRRWLRQSGRSRSSASTMV